MDYLNNMIKTQLEHRTIREFKEDIVPENIIDQLTQVASRTATSNGMQACSIIRITDPAIKKELADISTQEYVAKSGHGYHCMIIP